ncbi:hypothetical protein ACFYUY_24220 [Kitasatospora sp. NPDC004745]|uniref:hypothetical protein n=1 Tax=unclassified Kitasatospora TaxID=2633591 RepID=UPI0033E5FC27
MTRTTRSITWALTLLAAAGVAAAVPGTASADTVSGGNHGTVIIGNGNQVAGYDIINAGNDATVGSHNGSGQVAGGAMDDAAQVAGGNFWTVIIGDGNQIAGDDIINAENDATVGSDN